MTISRRTLLKRGIVAGTMLSVPSVLRANTAANDLRTVHWIPDDNLQVFDPLLTTTSITTQHALAIYDTLFAPDSQLMPKPQMVEKWAVSEDKKTYTFKLRDGLNFHDGSPVTAADCIASIRRWGGADSGGKLLLERTRDVSKRDHNTFEIVLKEPFGLLIDTLASAGLYLAIMREKDANRPATELATANIGSGPFIFNEALAKPGASFTYDRNERYVPRKEAPDGYAGGKVVQVDRVIWDNIADQQTALAALQAGEADFLQTPAADLYAVIQTDPNLELQLMNKSGRNMFMRMNCLQKPFSHVKARQAMLHLIDQEAMMRASGFDPRYVKTVTSIFGNTTPYSNDENTGWFRKGGDPEKARQLFKEAGYAGEKVVILQPTSWPEASNASQLLAATLGKIGVNAELAPSEWGAVVARRANKGSVEDGGWSIFLSDWTDAKLGNPLGVPFFLANGDKAWFGWPKNEEYENLRGKWSDVDTLAGGAGTCPKDARDLVGLRWRCYVGSLFCTLGPQNNFDRPHPCVVECAAYVEYAQDFSLMFPTSCVG